MAHTPGKWYVGKHGDNDSDVCAEGGPLICSLRGGAADACDTTADDDARLIAAAPELLAAAKLVLEAGDQEYVKFIVRDAISKAEGGKR